MSEATVSVQLTQEEYDTLTTKEPGYPCEVCGERRARYVVADLEKADTSLFCERDLIVTFATVANEVFKEME